MRSCALALALAIAGGGALAGPELRLKSNVIWKSTAPWFGGFSGAEVSPSGDEITLITDRGSLVTMQLIRMSGALSAVQHLQRRPLKDEDGRVLKNEQSDAEGLAVGADGSAYLTFEHDTRVAQLDINSGIATVLPRHPDFAGYDINKSLEALAIHPDGTLYTLPERTGARRTPFPLFAFKNEQWQITHKIPRRGPFLTVGADFDAAGRLYLLERAVSPLGFRSRIRRFDLNADALGEIILLTSGPGRFDNLEAISVWTDADGETQLTLISDDNFYNIQRTQIVEFSVNE